jgi:hypothetical protein
MGAWVSEKIDADFERVGFDGWGYFTVPSSS